MTDNNPEEIDDQTIELVLDFAELVHGTLCKRIGHEFLYFDAKRRLCLRCGDYQVKQPQPAPPTYVHRNLKIGAK